MTSRLPALVVTLGLLASSTACGDSPSGVSASGTWTALTPAPVSPRTGSAAAWTGTEAVFLGGVVGGLCPPTASCVAPEQTARDGAAYNPSTGVWRRTAPAPVDLPGYGRATVLGDRVYLLVGAELVRYDASEDAWHRERGPAPSDGMWSLMEGDDSLVAVRRQQREHFYPDQVYAPASRTWTALPRDPLVPSFDRSITSTPFGLVLTGQPEVDQPGSDLATSLTRAALLDSSGTWQSLPPSDQLAGGFTWTGRRLVAPALGGADGGEVNGYGRTVPYGGVLELPAGTWRRLPNAPDQLSGGWPIDAIDGARIAASGWFYDDSSGAWAKIPQPTGSPTRTGAAVWADDTLIAFGGLTPDAGYSAKGLSDQAFSYEP